MNITHDARTPIGRLRKLAAILATSVPAGPSPDGLRNSALLIAAACDEIEEHERAAILAERERCAKALGTRAREAEDATDFVLLATNDPASLLK